MRTEICDRLGIEFPIFAFTHCRDVAAAVSNAGGLGVLGAVGFTAEQLEVELTWLDEHVGDKPYGVDLVIPSKYEGKGIDGLSPRSSKPSSPSTSRRVTAISRPSCSPITVCRNCPPTRCIRSCWAGPPPPPPRRSR